MSSVDSEDRARCPILSCGTYLMLGRTREGTRAGEREGGSAARYRGQLGALHALRGAWRRDPRSLGSHRLPRASRLCKSIGRPIWRVFLAPRPRRPGRSGWARVSVPGTSVAALCVRPRGDCLIAPRSRPAYSAPAGGDDGVRLPAARASAARRARPGTGHFHC